MPAPRGAAAALVAAARDLSREVSRLRFAPPVAFVYNPLDYAWEPHRAYLERYGRGPKEVVFLGMNPGPFGMAQTGVPFGEVAAVREVLGIEAPVGRPAREHPKRPVEGFACARSEVSGRRLWGAVARRYGTADRFFARRLVANYCPLCFMEESGRNRTPDKLPAAEREPLFAACDAHLRRVVAAVGARVVVGVGAFAEARARAALEGTGVRVGRVLHPSPASPRANRDWEGAAAAELAAQGLCEEGAPRGVDP